MRNSGMTVLVYRLMVAADCGDISMSSVIRSPSDRSAWRPKRWEALFMRESTLPAPRRDHRAEQGEGGGARSLLAPDELRRTTEILVIEGLTDQEHDLVQLRWVQAEVLELFAGGHELAEVRAVDLQLLANLRRDLLDGEAVVERARYHCHQCAGLCHQPLRTRLSELVHRPSDQARQFITHTRAGSTATASGGPRSCSVQLIASARPREPRARPGPARAHSAGPTA